MHYKYELMYWHAFFLRRGDYHNARRCFKSLLFGWTRKGGPYTIIAANQCHEFRHDFATLLTF